MSATETEIKNDGALRLNPIAATARLLTVDRRFVSGVFLGLALLAGGYAVSQNGLAVVVTGKSDPKSELLSEQISIIAMAKKKEAEDCATGNVEGSVGWGINTALRVHLEFASAMPNVERLFDVNKDCFSGLSSLVDLSFAIPSLATIIAAAQQAVLEYAKKKICSAVGEVTTMVTGPINQAVTTVNGISGFGNLNGLTAGLGSPGGMRQVDPNLGAAYNVGVSGTYTTLDRFGNRGQASTTDTTGQGTTGQSQYERVQGLNQQLATAQGQLGPARQSAQTAQNNYDACVASGNGNCSAQQAQAQTAQTALTNLETQISALTTEINTLLGQQGGAGGTTTGKSSVAVPSQAGVKSEQSMTQRLSNLFR